MDLSDTYSHGYKECKQIWFKTFFEGSTLCGMHIRENKAVFIRNFQCEKHKCFLLTRSSYLNQSSDFLIK